MGPHGMTLLGRSQTPERRRGTVLRKLRGEVGRRTLARRSALPPCASRAARRCAPGTNSMFRSAKASRSASRGCRTEARGRSGIRKVISHCSRTPRARSWSCQEQGGLTGRRRALNGAPHTPTTTRPSEIRQNILPDALRAHDRRTRRRLRQPGGVNVVVSAERHHQEVGARTQRRRTSLLAPQVDRRDHLVGERTPGLAKSRYGRRTASSHPPNITSSSETSGRQRHRPCQSASLVASSPNSSPKDRRQPRPPNPAPSTTIRVAIPCLSRSARSARCESAAARSGLEHEFGGGLDKPLDPHASGAGVMPASAISSLSMSARVPAQPFGGSRV